MSLIPKITYILPTRNRIAWVGRAIQSCLDLDGPDLGVQVVVVDGRSTDGTKEMLQKTFGSDDRVRVISQQRPGRFTAACQEGLTYVNTDYASLMFDDDVLLPSHRSLPMILRQNGCEFGFGFGALCPIEKRIKAEPVRGIWWFEPRQLWEFYMGIRRPPGDRGLPESPLVAVATTRLWNLWSAAVENFCGDSSFRRMCMFEKSAGPDFLIYLLASLEAENPIPVLDGIVAQFSDHTGSLTQQLADLELSTGYWLSRVWLFWEARRRGCAAIDLAMIWAFVKKRGQFLGHKWVSKEASLALKFQEEQNRLYQAGTAEIPAYPRFKAIFRLSCPKIIRMVGLKKVRYQSFLQND